MKKQNLKISLLIIGAFCLGFFFFYNGTKGIFTEREVASINQSKVNNLKFLSSENLQKELSKKVKIYSLENEKVVALEGFTSQICKTFSRVELYFEAYGVSVSGEPSQFKITADCLAGQDPAEIAVIKIPTTKLMREKARSAEFKFSEYNETFELINSDEWSKTWVLSKIIFKSDSETKLINATADLLSHEQPVVLEF